MIDHSHDPITCAACGGDVVRQQTTIQVPMGSRGDIPVSGVFAQCQRCGEVYTALGEGDAIYRAACDVVREREGLLTPAEIVELREQLALTQAQLEAILRVGPKTVVRWERGTVFQSKAADTLLRTLRDVPEARTYLIPSAVSPTPASEDRLMITLEHAILDVQSIASAPSRLTPVFRSLAEDPISISPLREAQVA